LVTLHADESFRGWRVKKAKRLWLRSKRLWLPIVGIALVILISQAAWRPAKAAYYRWREHKHLDRAVEYFEKRDYKRAIIDARSVLAFNAGNKDALRLVAKTLEILRSPAAIEWRATLGRLAPDDLENTLGWASGAIQIGDFPTANRLLASTKPADRGTALYHQLAASVAMYKRDAVKAEYHWSEAAKLDPKEDVYKLNIATARLRLGSALERTTAIELLNQLRLKSEERLPAMRALISDALGHLETERALALAKALADDPKAAFSDKLLRLSTLKVLADPDFSIWRARLEAEALDRADYAYELLIWMNRNGYAKEVRTLTPRIPKEIVSRPPVSIAVADSYAVAQDWVELQAVLEDSSWYHMDYVRLATLAWANEKLGDTRASTAAWKNALVATTGARDRIETLAKAALSWGWEQRAEDALWSLTTGPHRPTWVLQTLWIKSLKRADTVKMQKIARLMVDANPKSVAARNNYIFLSLLLRSSDGSPHVAAETLFRENPTNPSAVSTYALSLFQLGRARAATEAMETLKPAQLHEPAVAIYYGSFLVAARRAARAEEYLEIGKQWPLLPEEQAMFQRISREAGSLERDTPPK